MVSVVIWNIDLERKLQYLPERSEEGRKYLSQDIRPSSQDSNPGPNEYEAVAPATEA
jgi:hypothetical protein